MPATGAFEAYLDEIPGLDAGVDLSNYRHHLVKMDGSGNVIPCATLGEKSIGILQDVPAAAGRGASVAFQGISKCVAGAAIARGAFVTTNASGRCITAAAGHNIVGFALTPATANAEVITVVLTNAGAVVAA